MAKHLSRRDIEAIVNLIRGWQDEKLTWPAICEQSVSLIGKKPTRQSLSAHEPIVAAYKAKKLSVRQVPARPRPASLQAAAARIANLEAQIDELREENRRYREQFTVWQYNAYKHGMQEHQLNQPLPKIDRERSDNEKR